MTKDKERPIRVLNFDLITDHKLNEFLVEMQKIGVVIKDVKYSVDNKKRYYMVIYEFHEEIGLDCITNKDLEE